MTRVCILLPSSLLDLFALNVGEGEIRCVLEDLSCAIRAKESFRWVDLLPLVLLEVKSLGLVEISIALRSVAWGR